MKWFDPDSNALPPFKNVGNIPEIQTKTSPIFYT
jgi:hypothetical protein